MDGRRHILQLHCDIAHTLSKASLCPSAKWSEVTVSYFIRLLPLLPPALPRPITGHPVASPTAALKCLKSLSPLQLYCLFAYLLCYGAFRVIQYVGFFITVSNLFLLYLCVVIKISARPGALSGIYTCPLLILKPTPHWTDQPRTGKKKAHSPFYDISVNFYSDWISQERSQSAL